MNKETHMIRQLTLEETRTYIRDDSVRPHLSAEFRTQENREVWGLFSDEQSHGADPLAVVCVAYAHGVPEAEYELDYFSLLDGAATLEPLYFDPEQFHKSRFETIDDALEYALENNQGKLTVFDNGTILNRLGESMVYDSQGNLAPAARGSMTQFEQNVAVFYTVWSYSKGAGRTLINTLSQHILDNRKEIWRWVTLSPLTEMAEKFHISNGATLVSVYGQDQTFEYTHLFFDLETRMREIQGDDYVEPDVPESLEKSDS
jgi:hypothetical protein